jgi:intracellular sulfur oxidation DsrE/DsrF family protein
MEDVNLNPTTHRRGFLGTIAAGAAAVGMATMGAPLKAAAEAVGPLGFADDADAFLAKVKSKKHRIVFDVTKPHEVMPFAWPKVYMITNAATGTPEKDNGVVVIFRHDGIPFAFNNEMWAKYKFGEVFKYDDPVTRAASVRNPFWQPKKGDFSVPGIGPVDIGINQLQDNGVMFCVCDVAMTVYSHVLAGSGDGDAIKKEWVANLLPGIQIVPSGVWAVGRAQEYGCAYCFAG